MKRQVIQSILILILILCPVLSHAAFDGTRPRDNDLLKDSAALIRTNFNALKDMIDIIYINYSSTDSVALKADKIYVDSNFSTTKEVELILFNLGTFEARLDSIENNILDMIQPAVDMLFANIETLENSVISNYNEFIANMQTHEAELAAITSEIGLITTNLDTAEDRLDSIETNILSMIQPAIDFVIANIETLEALVISNYNALYANFETHEAEIIALKVNDTTQEVRLVRAIAAYENRYKKMILQYGYPIAINDLWDVNKASAIYAMYDIVVFGDLYEKDTHEAHADTVNIITRLKELKTDVEIFGYVPIGGELGANLDTTEILLRIDEWLATGATGVFLDEYGYDYLVSRERQNMVVDYAHSKGMNIIANSWNIDWVFNNDDGYIEWEEFYGNPNLAAPSINANDYYLFENLFYYYEGGQKVSDQWRIFEVYRYYYDSATSTWGKNYYDQFGTKTLGLDGIQSTNANKDLYFINAYVGGRILNLDGYGASIELWGSSSTAYNHYNPSFFANEATVFNRDRIQPTVSDYSGATYAQYDTKINGITLKLLWKPGATASNPELGTHKVQISGVDRTKAYVSSSATNANTANTLVSRDASGNFSAGTITAALTGNASTATVLQTGRTIAGTIFNGAANIEISHLNLTDIGLKSHSDIDAAFGTIEIELDSISIAINNLNLNLSGGISGEVFTRTSTGYIWAAPASGVTDHLLLSNIGTLTHLELEAAIIELQANPAGVSSGSNSTIEVIAAETLILGDVVSLININDVISAKKTENTNVAGISQTACDTDEACVVLVKGSDTHQSGLIVGANYYRQADYSIGTTPVSINGNYIFVGYAKSSVEIILD